MGRSPRRMSRWQWSIGWPNFAALGAAAVAGFIVGVADLNATSTLANDNSEVAEMAELLTPAVTLEENSW
jgi:hypothetical protein